MKLRGGEDDPKRRRKKRRKPSGDLIGNKSSDEDNNTMNTFKGEDTSNIAVDHILTASEADDANDDDINLPVVRKKRKKRRVAATNVQQARGFSAQHDLNEQLGDIDIDESAVDNAIKVGDEPYTENTRKRRKKKRSSVETVKEPIEANTDSIKRNRKRRSSTTATTAPIDDGTKENSIDATIEIPSEKDVFGNVFSAVKVSDDLTSVGGKNESDTDLRKQLEESPVEIDVHADTVIETAALSFKMTDNVEMLMEDESGEVHDPAEVGHVPKILPTNEIESEHQPPGSTSINAANNILNGNVDNKISPSIIQVDDSLDCVEMRKEDKQLYGSSNSILDETIVVGQDELEPAEVESKGNESHEEVICLDDAESQTDIDRTIESKVSDQIQDTFNEDTIEDVGEEIDASDDRGEIIDENEQEAVETNAECESDVQSPILTSSEERIPEVTDVEFLADDSTILDHDLDEQASADVTTGSDCVSSSVVNEGNEETVEVANELDEDSLVVSIVTWNLGEASPSEKEASFIKQFRKGSDLVMIGAQECEDIKPRRAEGHRSRHLRQLGIQMLGEQYVPIAIHSLGGIQMALYCRRDKLADVEFIDIADVTCGVGNVFHNKGAIGVYLKMRHHRSDSDIVKSSKLLLVTGHLAAHVKNVDARNDDFRRIISELEAQAPVRFLRPRKNRDGSLVVGDGTHLLNTMDHVIFSGDLNYRIDLPREYVDRCIKDINNCQMKQTTDQKQMNKLLRRDQLLCTIASGRAFANFNEGKIAFLPTFKFDKGSSEYDTSYKQRIPAWTDRILFKSNNIRVIEYNSVPKAMHSDHRPVFGTFQLGWGSSSMDKKPKGKHKRR